ncbi:hypothetical protein BKA83DRAFT_4124579 [Pisolithus microcarpus]|nr:hypothetical protein BKA83DRAFT_4124579 [Pisolithus microcarpus]
MEPTAQIETLRCRWCGFRPGAREREVVSCLLEKGSEAAGQVASIVAKLSALAPSASANTSADGSANGTPGQSLFPVLLDRAPPRICQTHSPNGQVGSHEIEINSHLSPWRA